MTVPFRRWFAGVALGCGALAAFLVPFPRDVAEQWSSPVPAPIQREVSQLATDVGRAQAARRAYRSAIGLARWRTVSQGADTASIRVDESVPHGVAAAVRSTIAEQWQSLGAASGAHAQVFVYVDTTAISRAATAATAKRALEPRGFVEIAFALPEATDGARCVSLVRLLGTSAAHVDALRHQSVVGPCGFFAAFGLPGAGNREWLTATAYRFAQRSDWHVALAPITDAAAVYGLGPAGGRCLTGVAGACLALLEVGGRARPTPAASSQLDFVVDGFSAASAVARARGRSELGNVETELLMAAVREFGPERFARFWKSNAPPGAAFVAATGLSLDDWARRWMQRTFGHLPDRPTPRVSHVAWLVAGAPLLLLLAARPRERVLAAS